MSSYRFENGWDLKNRILTWVSDKEIIPGWAEKKKKRVEFELHSRSEIDHVRCFLINKD